MCVCVFIVISGGLFFLLQPKFIFSRKRWSKHSMAWHKRQRIEKRLSFTTKSEWTDWQVVLGPLKGAVGELRRECTLDFRREQLEKGGGLLCLPGEDRRVLALNSFAFLWFKSRIFFFFHLHNHYFELLTILWGAFTCKSTKNRQSCDRAFETVPVMCIYEQIQRWSN